MWALLAQAVNKSLFESQSNARIVTWDTHPFGKPLLDSIVAHRAKLLDIQSLVCWHSFVMLKQVAMTIIRIFLWHSCYS